MSVRRVSIPEIGEVTLVKRRGVKNLRLSVTASGKVRVSMPSWTPYPVGIKFAQSRAAWINSHLDDQKLPELTEGLLIGKAHRLHFVRTIAGGTSSRLSGTSIEISTPLPFSNDTVQSKALLACEKALREEAENLLPQRLKTLADQYGFKYKQVRIRKLTSHWGSCSRENNISLSYYLVQLPWSLIDYVLLHELVHTRHHNHSTEFWQAFEEILPNAKATRKEIRKHKLRLTAHQKQLTCGIIEP